MVVLSIISLLAMIKFVEFYVRKANRSVADAQGVAKLALEGKVTAEEEVVTAKAEVEKIKIEAIQEVDHIASAYEQEIEGDPKQSSHRGYVYLGICQDRWVRSYFSNLPKCVDGPLEKPVTLKCLRGAKLRAAPPTQAGIGREVNRIKAQGSVSLMRMISVNPTDTNALQIFWGEIEFP